MSSPAHFRSSPAAAVSAGTSVAVVLAAGLLLGRPGPARGQVPAAVPRPGRWYAGAGAVWRKYYARQLPFSQIQPAYAAAGYWLTPQVALQAELQYGARTQPMGGATSVSNGQTFAFHVQALIHSAALTVVLRRGLGRPARRLWAEAVLGLAVVHGQSTETLTATTPAGTQTSALPGHRSTEPHAVAGLGAGYRLGPRWAAVAEVTVHKNLLVPFGAASGGLGSGANAGLTYRFGNATP